jgi:hypothetical protein
MYLTKPENLRLNLNGIFAFTNTSNRYNVPLYSENHLLARGLLTNNVCLFVNLDARVSDFKVLCSKL